ncbi:MAG TPA: hypothetical protein VJT67_02100 [Longimicrobiaceae bacterium]|nr:hypothetical protein [Longimicrobiaceae bacterium]
MAVTHVRIRPGREPAPPAMPFTVADTMALVRAHAAPELVDAAAWDAAAAIAAQLPAGVAGGFYLECRLDEEGGPVDWIPRVHATGREILAGRNPRIRVPREVAWSAGWGPVARFCARWSDDVRLRRAVAEIWLEFDLPAGGDGFPAPSVFVAFDPAAVAALGDGEWSVLLGLLLDELAPETVSAETRAAVQAALRSRPAAATVPYVGFLLARPEQAVRLYLGSVDAAALPAAFAAAGWPGDPRQLADVIARLDGGTAPRVGMAHLDFADGGALPRVGIEFTLGRRAQHRGTIAEAAFLDRLVERGLATAPKRRALDAWPGHEVRVLPHELWRSLLSRRVNCVKLVHVPGEAPRVKAYLLARWSPVPRGSERVEGLRAVPAE